MSTPLSIARVSTQMQSSLLLSTLQQSQLSLLKVQQQLTTGQRLNQASDDPAAALSIESFKRQLSGNDTYASNLDFASGMLAQADSALGSLNDLITQAQSIASSQVGATSSSDERAAQAEIVNSLLTQALTLANTRYQGQAVFGGQNGIDDPFVAVGGGFKYQGTTSSLAFQSPTGSAIRFSLGGDSAFGAVSSQVVGTTDLSPALTNSTRLADLGGAQSAGIRPGSLNVNVGFTSITVDLTNAATVGDVVSAVNAAFASNGSDASISISGRSLTLNADSTQPTAVVNSANSYIADDLGLLTGVTLAAGTSGAGVSVQPRLTATTPLSALNGGAGVNTAGLVISNGAATATIALSGLSTVEDLLNRINDSGTNVQAQINAAGTGINIFNPLSGTELRIGENGGTSATDLGIRSLTTTTNLAEFNNGTGVTPISGTLSGPSGQLLVTTTAGTQFAVQVDGISTPAQLIAAINSATGNTSITAALNASGNGVTLTDSSGGSGTLSVAAGSNFVSNGTDLGIVRSGTGATLAGTNITFSTDDFRITRRDGSSFTVSLGGSPAAATVQDVLNRINSADGNGGTVVATLNATGNGIQLADSTAGSGSFAVTALNGSSVAGQLGILKTASPAAPGLIQGDDNNPVEPQGIFSTLTMLRDALLQNDTRGIARAAALLEKDSARAIKAQGVTGAWEKDVSARKDDTTAQKTQLKAALSLLADTDFTEAATRFQQIQTAYQASLQVAQQTTNLSLLDFLK